VLYIGFTGKGVSYFVINYVQSPCCVVCFFFLKHPVVLCCRPAAFAVWLCDLELDVIVEDFGVC
jgi:hypothetical protein